MGPGLVAPGAPAALRPVVAGVRRLPRHSPAQWHDHDPGDGQGPLEVGGAGDHGEISSAAHRLQQTGQGIHLAHGVTAWFEANDPAFVGRPFPPLHELLDVHRLTGGSALENQQRAGSLLPERQGHHRAFGILHEHRDHLHRWRRGGGAAALEGAQEGGDRGPGQPETAAAETEQQQGMAAQHGRDPGEGGQELAQRPYDDSLQRRPGAPSPHPDPLGANALGVHRARLPLLGSTGPICRRPTGRCSWVGSNRKPRDCRSKLNEAPQVGT